MTDRFDNLCSSHLQSQSELYHASWWYYTLVIDLIGQLQVFVTVIMDPLPNYVAMLLVVCQLSRDVIGYEDS